MPLADDPKILEGPFKFALRVNNADDLDIDATRRRIPGLLQFAKTFIGQVLEQEFNIQAGGYPFTTRERAAAQTARLKAKSDAAPARSLLMAVVDICDFEIDVGETYGSEDEEGDEEERRDEILDLIERLLTRFATWLDEAQFKRLAERATEAAPEFAAASEKLKLT